MSRQHIMLMSYFESLISSDIGRISKENIYISLTSTSMLQVSDYMVVFVLSHALKTIFN